MEPKCVPAKLPLFRVKQAIENQAIPFSVQLARKIALHAPSQMLTALNAPQAIMLHQAHAINVVFLIARPVLGQA